MKRFKKIPKSWMIDYLKLKLKNTDWAMKGLIRIYENQTVEEKSRSNTISKNDIGFTSPDATLLTPIALKYIKFLNKKSEYSMTITEAKMVINKMPKYREQIFNMSNINKLIGFMIKDGFVNRDDNGYYHKVGMLNRKL